MSTTARIFFVDDESTDGDSMHARIWRARHQLPAASLWISIGGRVEEVRPALDALFKRLDEVRRTEASPFFARQIAGQFVIAWQHMTVQVDTMFWQSIVDIECYPSAPTVAPIVSYEYLVIVHKDIWPPTVLVRRPGQWMSFDDLTKADAEESSDYLELERLREECIELRTAFGGKAGR